METNIITISSNNLTEFIAEIEQQNIKNNTIIDCTNVVNLSIKEINLFLPLAKKFKKEKKSLVIVAININFNKVSDKINVVPSLQEAHDFIEMEEIERDLEL